MNRGQMIEKAALAIIGVHNAPGAAGYVMDAYSEAAAVLDAILPQVTTVEELEALPVGTRLLSEAGRQVRIKMDPRAPDFRFVAKGESWSAPAALGRFGPLTVVWRPET